METRVLRPDRPRHLGDENVGDEDGWAQGQSGTRNRQLPRDRRGHRALSSAAARRPHPGSPIAYAAAKAGIELLTQDVAAQAGPFGIRANCLAPETILTENNERMIPEPIKEELRNAHPLRRLGTPEDVARAAAFLASDASAWITGIIVDVAGGAVMV